MGDNNRLRHQVAKEVTFTRPAGPLPGGPASLEASFGWAEDSLSALTFDELRNYRAVCSSLRVSSHCSGMGCLEQIIEKLGCAQSSTACDILASRRLVLSSLSAAPQHIFRGLEERLPLELRQRIAMLLPKIEKKKTALTVEAKEQCIAAYRQVGSIIFDFFDSEPELESYCEVHDKMRKTAEPVPASAITLNGAGTSCEDMSSMGTRLKTAGPSMVAFYTWLAERKQQQEVIVLHENTEAFDSNLIACELGRTHRCFSLMLDPRSMGYPVRRLRRITLCVRRDYLLTMKLEDFLLKMGRSMNMPPNEYFALDDGRGKTGTQGEESNIQKYIIAEKRGLMLKNARRALYNGGNINASWDEFLLPLQRERLGHFINEMLPQLQAQCKVDNAQNVIVDLDQNPQHRPRLCCDADGLTSSMPTLISHNCLWHCRLKRPLLAHECLLLQGSEVVPGLCGRAKPAWPTLALLEQELMSPHTLSSLSGLAWHIPSIGKLLIYILAGLRRADWVLQRCLSENFNDPGEEEEI